MTSVQIAMKFLNEINFNLCAYLMNREYVSWIKFNNGFVAAEKLDLISLHQYGLATAASEIPLIALQGAVWVVTVYPDQINYEWTEWNLVTISCPRHMFSL